MKQEIQEKQQNETNKVELLENLLSTPPFDNRMTWNEYFMAIALLVSHRSPSPRLKVGSVIVSNRHIISCGYNGFPAGAPHVSIARDNHEQNTIHAEQNAISEAAKRGVSVNESTIYITHYPCINCLKYILSSGIKNIIYLHDYKNDEIIPQIILPYIKVLHIMVMRGLNIQVVQLLKHLLLQLPLIKMGLLDYMHLISR